MVEIRGGGSGGLPPPPKCARKCANFRNLKANVQILDRKTPPPNGLPYFAYWGEAYGLPPHTHTLFRAELRDVNNMYSCVIKLSDKTSPSTFQKKELSTRGFFFASDITA